jgi:hypothetical protein
MLLFQARPNLRFAEHLCGILVHVSASGFMNWWFTSVWDLLLVAFYAGMWLKVIKVESGACKSTVVAFLLEE